MRWHKRLEIGVAKVDKQHEEIFKRANSLMESRSKGAGSEELEEMMDFLGDYVQEHFTTEERIQQKYNYPNYEEHKEIHDQFIAQIEQLRKDYQADDTAAIIKLNKFILDWIVKHVKKEDQKIADYINN